MSVAIDFANKNEDNKHNQDVKDNIYVQIIKEFGKILEYYDDSKLIPLYGFGGQLEWCKPQNSRVASQCFALSGDIFDPTLDSIEEVYATYIHSIPHVKLWGPANLNEVIDYTNQLSM